MPRTAAAVAGLDGDPAELLRERLIDAAEALLAERSPAAITTRALAKAAGVSDGVLYNHFDDKSAVVVTALVRRFSALVERFQAALPAPGEKDIQESLETVALALLELNTDAAPLFSKLLGDPKLLDRFVAAIHSRDIPFGGEQIRDGVVTYLSAEQERGRLGAIDIVAAADLLLAVSAGVAVVGLVAPFDRGARIAAAVDALLHGLNPTTTKER
jgi:AcrR family transcriptional regulator